MVLLVAVVTLNDPASKFASSVFNLSVDFINHDDAHVQSSRKEIQLPFHCTCQAKPFLKHT